MPIKNNPNDLSVLKVYNGYKIMHKVVQRPMASLATEIATRIAFATGTPNEKEDSAGRSYLRLLSPEEVATRACEIADALYRQYAARDWLDDVPESFFKKPEEVAADD